MPYSGMSVAFKIVAEIDRFRRTYGVPPNTVTVGTNVAHELREVARYTMPCKPVKFDERGNMRVCEIPILVDYEYPDKIEISLIMEVNYHGKN